MALCALIFDFDGLIVDTESSSLAMVKEAYRRHGLDLSDDQWRLCVGSAVDPYEHLQRLVGPEVNLTEMREELELRFQSEVVGLRPRPGVVEFVTTAAAAGVRLAVAASASRRWVEGHLARINILEYFHTIRCLDDVQQAKPAPDVYLEALASVGVSASQAAAKTAGIYTVVVPNGVTSGWLFDHADRVIDSLRRVTISQVAGWLTHRSSFA